MTESLYMTQIAISIILVLVVLLIKEPMVVGRVRI
jgi:hypothetical protein